MRVVGCSFGSCGAVNGHFFLCSFSLFVWFFLFWGNWPKDEYIEVLKKNAVECGKGTLQAFSDQRAGRTCTQNTCSGAKDGEGNHKIK